MPPEVPLKVLSTSTGAYLSEGGVWIDSSDRDLKENFTPVDGQEVLASLAEMPITTWNYTAENASIRHMGPTSQDFYAAFGLDKDDGEIFHMDADGVALAAIQGLYEFVQDLKRENAGLKAQLADMGARLAALEGGAPLERGSESLLSSIMPFGPLFLAGLFVVGGLVLVQRRRAGGRS